MYIKSKCIKGLVKNDNHRKFKCFLNNQFAFSIEQFGPHHTEHGQQKEKEDISLES